MAQRGHLHLTVQLDVCIRGKSVQTPKPIAFVLFEGGEAMRCIRRSAPFEAGCQNCL